MKDGPSDPALAALATLKLATQLLRLPVLRACSVICLFKVK